VCVGGGLGGLLLCSKEEEQLCRRIEKLEKEQYQELLYSMPSPARVRQDGEAVEAEPEVKKVRAHLPPNAPPPPVRPASSAPWSSTVGRCTARHRTSALQNLLTK